MFIIDEFKSRNFSLYAQWLGVVSIVLLIVLGVLSLVDVAIFAIVGWVFALILIFVEVSLFTKCCCDGFIAGFQNSYFRSALYLVFAIVMFLSTIDYISLLLIPASTLLLTSISYGIAGIKNQPHVSTKILGGTGVDTPGTIRLLDEEENGGH